MSPVWRTCVVVLGVFLNGSASAHAETLYVAAGGNLQAALDAARPGDTIVLAEGAEFVGNFVLRAKSGEGWIRVTTSAPASALPPDGVRIGPSHAPLLARLRSPNTLAALRTAPGAHHWELRYLEFGANKGGYGDIMQIGDGSSAQNSLALVPHHIVLAHVYVHGDARLGQKRCISLHAAHVTIRDSHISECKAVGQDSQAICGWNGPGPYLIENNYLEAAGENVMFGGAAPAIPYVIADGVTLRHNHLSRPLSWRTPILGTPQGVSAVPEGGGTLQPGTFAYRVVARGPVGQGVTGRSTASAEVTATVGAAGSAVRVRWQAVTGATEYRVYGRTPDAQNVFWTTTAPELVDSGAAGASESVPTSPGTVWSVKNLFELKSARNVVLEDNILENHWKESQPGYAIVLTPRNPDASCTWCGVEHIRLEYNLVRNVAAGINLIGSDAATRPTKQTNDIVIRNNLFAGMVTSLGGNGSFLQVGDSPRDLVIEHNTIEGNGSTVMYTYGGSSTDPKEVYGLRMMANAARHGSYGFNGAYFSYGNAILANYYPDGVFVGNYLAGGAASRYPAGNLFSGSLPEQYVNAAAGDFTLRPGSLLRGAAPDGTDIGVDYGALSARVAGVVNGVMPGSSSSSEPPTADFTWTCTHLNCQFTSTSVLGTNALAAWAWTFGDGGQAVGAQVAHQFAQAGAYPVALTVTDTLGLAASVTRSLEVEAAPAPGPCASIAPAEVTMPSYASATSVSVTAGSGCAWTVSSQASWLTVTSGAGGTGSGTVAIDVATNFSSAPRTGTVTLGERTFTVTQQAAGACSYAITPSTGTSPAAGETVSIAVSTASGCVWTTSSDSEWLAVTAGATGTGSGTVSVTVAPNPTGTMRTGSVRIAGRSFLVSQAGQTCTYEVTPTSVSAGAEGLTGSISVTTIPGCAWAASSPRPWVTLSGKSFVGSGSASFTIAPNTGPARSGSVRVANQSVTITQAGRP